MSSNTTNQPTFRLSVTELYDPLFVLDISLDTFELSLNSKRNPSVEKKTKKWGKKTNAGETTADQPAPIVVRVHTSKGRCWEDYLPMNLLFLRPCLV